MESKRGTRHFGKLLVKDDPRRAAERRVDHPSFGTVWEERSSPRRHFTPRRELFIPAGVFLPVQNPDVVFLTWQLRVSFLHPFRQVAVRSEEHTSELQSPLNLV